MPKAQTAPVAPTLPSAHRRRDVIDYIRTMTGQLGTMAEDAHLGLLAHFLKLARLAAEAISEPEPPTRRRSGPKGRPSGRPARPRSPTT